MVLRGSMFVLMLMLDGFESQYVDFGLKPVKISIGMLILIGFEWKYVCFDAYAG
jgi:hypothetical protein